MKRTLFFLFLALVCSPATTARAQTPRPEAALTIVSAGPQGEVASLAEANEIRVVFSEPMVTLGRIPARVQPAFFKMDPVAPGTFRWSGTTILIFTPDPKRPLAQATTYNVTIAAGATAVSGRKLARPFTFTLTTPTVKLLRTEWYRIGDRFDGRLVVALRFNQPVRPRDVLAHATARFSAHEWSLKDLDALRDRLRSGPAGQQGADRLDAKVAATRAVAAATGPVQLALASDWDKKTLSAVAGPRGGRSRDGRAAGKLGHRRARRAAVLPRGRRDARQGAGLHGQGPAGVLHRAVRVRIAVQPGQRESVGDACPGQD